MNYLAGVALGDSWISPEDFVVIFLAILRFNCFASGFSFFFPDLFF